MRRLTLRNAAVLGTILVLASNARAQQPRSGQQQTGLKATPMDMSVATPLDKAAYQGQLDKVEYFIQMGAYANGTDKNGATPLNYAIAGAHTHVAEYLLAHGADGTPALNDAIFADNMTLIQFLLAHGASVSPTKDVLPLDEAAEKDHLDIVKLLIAAGAVINAKTSGSAGDTPLCAATDIKQGDVAMYLLSHGADVSATCSYPQTPLLGASRNGLLNVVKELVKRGADVNACSSGGYVECPLIAALNAKQAEIALFLIAHGADVNAPDYMSLTPLMHAAEDNYLAVVQALLAKGANIDARYKFGGYSALDEAMMWGNDNIAAYLVAQGADVNYESGVLGSPVGDAIRRNNADEIRLLVSAPGFQPDDSFQGFVGAGDTQGYEVLEWASGSGHWDFLNSLPVDAKKRLAQASSTRALLFGGLAAGQEQLVQFMVANGADVNSQFSGSYGALGAGFIGRTPLASVVLNQKLSPDVRLNEVQFLIADGALPNVLNAPNAVFPQLLCDAVYAGDGLNLIQYLVEHGARPKLLRPAPRRLQMSSSMPYGLSSCVDPKTPPPPGVIQYLKKHGAKGE